MRTMSNVAVVVVLLMLPMICEKAQTDELRLSVTSPVYSHL